MNNYLKPQLASRHINLKLDDPLTPMRKWLKRYSEEALFYSTKFDGERCIAEFLEGPEGIISYYSRSGECFSNYDCFTEQLNILKIRMARRFQRPLGMLDGEVLDPRGQAFLRQQSQRVHDVDTSNLMYFIFDVPKVVAKLVTRVRYMRYLRQCSKDLDRIHIVQHTELPSHDVDFIMELFNDKVAQGYEGLVIKRGWETYREGPSRKDWLKIKESYTEDLRVVGVKEGRGKDIGTAGALICEYEGELVNVSGFTYAEAEKFLKNPPKVVEAAFHQVTENQRDTNSLRHPTFVRVRNDLNGEFK